MALGLPDGVGGGGHRGGGLLLPLDLAGEALLVGLADAVLDGRSGEFVLEMCGLALTSDIGAALHQALQTARRSLEPYVTGATYLNFTEGAERQERTATAYSDDHMRRLQAVKDAVDSADRYCHGFGVTPR